MDPTNNLISFDFTVDNVQQGDNILLTYRDGLLTEAKTISNVREIPADEGVIRHETQSLDTFVGLNVKDWDGHSPMTCFLRPDGEYDHAVKTRASTAAGAAA